MKSSDDEDEQLTEVTAPSSSALQYQRSIGFSKAHQRGSISCSQPHQAGASRVADYFAVLGTGSTFTRKQKESRGSDSSATRSEEDANQEEEYARIQRWYREIIHVQLVGSDPFLEELLTREGRPHQSVLSAPSSTNSLFEAEQNGYEILRFTRGSSSHPFQNNNTTFSQEDSILNSSNLDTTITSTSYNHTMYSSVSNSSTANPEEMIFDANIHPRHGIQRDVLLYKTGYASFPRVHPPKSARLKAVSNSNDTEDTVRALQKLGDIASRVVGRAIQLPRKHTESDFSGVGESNNTPSFYVAYRRRLPDENEIPALADIRIMYLQLPLSCLSKEHREPILPPELSNNEKSISTPSSRSTTGVMDRRSLNGLPWKRNTVSTLRTNSSQSCLEGQDNAMNLKEEMKTGSNQILLVPLRSVLRVPNGFDEVVLPSCLESFEIQREILLGQRIPKIVEMCPVEAVMIGPFPDHETSASSHCDETNMYVPVLVTRRMRVGEEERWNEDPGIVDISITYLDVDGHVSLDLGRLTEADDEDEFNEAEDESLLSKTSWRSCAEFDSSQRGSTPLGIPVLIYRHNIPLGFCDIPFAARVLDRFPPKDYKYLPFLQEELPLFCYPTGIRLQRRKYRDMDTPECFSFIVKNERGNEIHVSVLSFEELLSQSKLEQLRRWSYRRKRTCLAHRRYCESNDMRGDLEGLTMTNNIHILTGFEEWTTVESKAICIISRFPYISAFRQFLTHLHTLSTSHSEIPIERYISHLLLSIPVPKSGGQSVLLPLSTCATPVLFSVTHAKDFPLLDLSYHILFSCLDVPTVVTILLGFLVLERGKIILVSKFSSLVTDTCELLRSLVFPFEICAPYVPRLTEPFRSCLDFPGAIFAGIHDNSIGNCLAAQVRQNLPEETILVDLDTGEIQCNGERDSVLRNAWNLLPPDLRVSLVEDVEALCMDAGIVSGQEALPPADAYCDQIGGVVLDDRAVRDAFFRFFCRVLSGYENYLRFPDANYLISGEEWFDTQRFVAAAPPSLQAFLASLVTTQLFQSFIQRRTESSDFRCMLLDECIAAYYKDGGKSFGRKACSQGELPVLLVDQCSSENLFMIGSDSGVTSTASIAGTDMLDVSTAYKIADLSYNISKENFMINCEGDIVMFPSLHNIPSTRFSYLNGDFGRFPEQFDLSLFSPSSPDSYGALDGLEETKVPILTRSGKEFEDAVRSWNAASSRGASKRQRKCLWQLPKLTASHFFGAYALCVPTQVAQLNLSVSQQSHYLARVFGVLRFLRHCQRIVADEATYRSLIIACGRVATDRRAEIVNLFGLMRQQGVVPSSVTLGQYTSAIAEGFRKRNISHNTTTLAEIFESEAALNKLDKSILLLENAGKNFAHHNKAVERDERIMKSFLREENENKSEDKLEIHIPTQIGHNVTEKSKNYRSWKPVFTSSSFAPFASVLQVQNSNRDRQPFCKSDFMFVALWTRSSSCVSCGYSALDEEIQASWDKVPHDYIGSFPCPRCSVAIMPMLGYHVLSLEEALDLHGPPIDDSAQGQIDPDQSYQDLPPQLQKLSASASLHQNQSSDDDENKGFVPYINPFLLRSLLERAIEEKGEEILHRDTLLVDPVGNIDVTIEQNLENSHHRIKPVHFCAFSSWDRCIALSGCASGAKAVSLFLESRAKLTGCSKFISKPEYSLLDSLSLQQYTKRVWEHQQLSEILVELISAANQETRDLTFALEALLRQHQALKSSVSNREDPLDCYRTLLYLVRYHCTSGFHFFFPTRAKPCKGYHFWCAKGTPLPPFDRMYREAISRLPDEADRVLCASQEVSDLALGFRSIYGHII